jgi:hypothetical protein
VLCSNGVCPHNDWEWMFSGGHIVKHAAKTALVFVQLSKRLQLVTTSRVGVGSHHCLSGSTIKTS